MQVIVTEACQMWTVVNSHSWKEGKEWLFLPYFLPVLSSVVSTRVVFSDHQGHGDGYWPDCYTPGRSSWTGGSRSIKQASVDSLKMLRSEPAWPDTKWLTQSHTVLVSKLPGWHSPLSQTVRAVLLPRVIPVYPQRWSLGQQRSVIMSF